MITNHSYPKAEKLKSRKAITELFTTGKSVSKYPIRLAFLPNPYPEVEKIKIGVSVSKRYFKKATDRNYIKRLMRETYRLNKQLLHANVDKPYVCMLLYQSKEILTFEQLNTKTIQLFEKFNQYISNPEL